jgi:succinate dehydrogenase flavin-adding protein (antitoxin of CptAB toxin-antitoxin module)
MYHNTDEESQFKPMHSNRKMRPDKKERKKGKTIYKRLNWKSWRGMKVSIVNSQFFHDILFSTKCHQIAATVAL